MGIKKYEIKIKSISPVIWNRLKKELWDEQQKLKKNELAEWEEVNWIRKLEAENDKAVVPISWLKSMFYNASKSTRIVPHFETRKSATYTKYIGAINFEKVSSPGLVKSIIPFGAFMGSQGANSGGKVYRIRPMLEKWDLSFVFIDPLGRMLKSEIEEMLNYAGMFIGLGDSRINNFGRFEVVNVKEVK